MDNGNHHRRHTDLLYQGGSQSGDQHERQGMTEDDWKVMRQMIQQAMAAGNNGAGHLEKKPVIHPKIYATPRERLLLEAMEITHKDRNANYGNPEDSFKQIAELWSAYKKVHFSSEDVAIMSMLIKVARLSKNPGHKDSAVDIAGYAACLGDIQENTNWNKARAGNQQSQLQSPRSAVIDAPGPVLGTGAASGSTLAR
jgi:hypothetical protein